MASSTNRAWALAAAGVALIALAGGVYSCTREDSSDRLTDAQAGIAQPGAENMMVNDTEAQIVDPVARCGAPATFALLKRALFRRAAEIRGRDSEMFSQVAAAAVLRVDRPVVTSSDEGLGSIACAAGAALDLPPGLSVASGRTSLGADLGYTLQPAADGSGDVIGLSNADPIVVPLATLTRVAPVEPEAEERPAEQDPLAAAEPESDESQTENFFEGR